MAEQLTEFEEEFSEKYSFQNSAQKQFRNKRFNKNSRNFANQLKTAFGNRDISPEVPFNLDQIYYARSPSSSILQHPVLLDQLDFYKAHRNLALHEPLSCPKLFYKEDESGYQVCNGVYMESLDEIQQIRNLTQFGYGSWPWSYGITLRPITQSIQLHFKGIRKFGAAVESLIEEHLSGTNLTILDAKDCTAGGAILYKSKLSVGKDHLKEVKPFRKEYLVNHMTTSTTTKIIFDEQDHSILLIPRLAKSGFVDFDAKEELKFPFQVSFNVDGQNLKHEFTLPLTFLHQPQRLRLKFNFEIDGTQIIIISYFMVYSIVPHLPVPTVSATINLFEKNFNHSDGSLKFDPTEAECETQRLVKTVLDNKANGDYWATGKRLRYNTVPVETIRHNGFAIGFNYVYEIQPKPNREMKTERAKMAYANRREIQRNIKMDLRDYKNGRSY